MKKTVILLIWIVLITTALVGCEEQKAYRYIDGDGSDYLVVNQNLIPQNSDIEGVMEHVPVIVADSMPEMITKIENGDFSEQDYYFLAKWKDKDEQGRVILPDLQNLLEPIAPDNVQWTQIKVYERKEYQYICMCDDFIVTVYFDVTDWYNPLYDGASDWPNISTSSPEEEIQNARAMGADGLARYQLHTDSLVFYVVELNEETSPGSGVYTSEKCLIWMLADFGEGCYMEIRVKQFQEYPSLEWLSSFDFKAYEG